MRGSVFKRCQCRDANGKRIKNCRKPHGSWSYVVDAGTDPETGKRRQITRSGFKTKPEAEDALTAELAKLNAGTWTDDKGMTLGRWLDQWLAELAAANRAVNTITNYRTHVRDAWKPQLGHMLLRDVRRGHIERVLAALAAPLDGDRPTGNVGRRVTRRSPATIESYRKTIRAALAAAQRRELIAVNPALGRLDAIPRPTAETDDEPVMWEMEDTARFLEHVMSDRLSALYELAAYGGLRRAELCGLRWSDIDPDCGGLTVRLTNVAVTRKQVTPEQARCSICGAVHVGRLLKPPKSRAGRRWVPLAAPAQEALARHRAAQQIERDLFGLDYDDHDLVFCRPDGLPLRPDRVTAEFEQHVRDCGLPVIRLHDTRHGACSLMLAGGVPIEVVQMILGHASPDVTRRVYKHILRKVTSKQVEKASKLLTRHRPKRKAS
ncbi:site-specific integrase [Planosporangium mesophilum]|uniref:Site-specific integrase n=1 Tax=Planosporangium mesophilum TaxID=689768 RepID=A0A8J3TH90_9ACTN|nr:tyrosine-type recombinase/integrase [Planosporangium mesophilum]NJC82530.1 site-specific integrase [Planosporangium mesophilum]GII25466.1 site-specific integrase [Planosporangium mesophilum]